MKATATAKYVRISPRKADLLAALIRGRTAVGPGPTLKRIRPRARGSAAPIHYRTSQIKFILASTDLAAKEQT
jgi:ribosomal protein L22